MSSNVGSSRLTRRTRLAQNSSPAIRRKKSRDGGSGYGGNISSSNSIVSTESTGSKNEVYNNKKSKKPLQPVLTADTQSSLSKHLPAPRTVTPTGTSSATSSPSPSSNGVIASRSTNSNSNNSYPAVRSAPSWEDYDEGLYGAASKKAKQRQQKQHQIQSDRKKHSTSSFDSTPDDEEMPMDEMMHVLHRGTTTPVSSANSKSGISGVYNNSVNIIPDIPSHSNGSNVINASNDNSNSNLSSTKKGPKIHSVPDVRAGTMANNRSIEASATMIPTRPPIVSTCTTSLSNTVNDDVSSLGGVEDHATGIGRILSALKHGALTHRPNALNAEEKLLWDSIQKAIAATRHEQMAKRRALENQLHESNSKLEQLSSKEAELERQLARTKTQLAQIQKEHSAANSSSRSSSSEDCDSGSAASLKLRLASLEEQLKQCQTELSEKEAEHEAEVRAIQRVLADVTSDREEEHEELVEKVSVLSNQVEELKAERISWQKEKESIQSSGSSFDSERAAFEAEKEKLRKEKAMLEKEKTTLEAEKNTLSTDNLSLKEENSSLRAHNEALEKENIALQEELAAVEEEKSTLLEENETLEGEKAALQDENAALEDEKVALIEEKASLEADISALEAEKSELQEALEKASDEAKDTSTVTLASTASEDASRSEQLEKEIQELKEALKAMKAEKVAAKRETDKKQRRLIVLERDIKVAKSQLKKVEEDLTKRLKEADETKRKAQVLEEEVALSKKQVKELTDELEEKDKQLKKAKRAPIPAPPTPPRQASFDNDSVSSEEVEILQKSLADTVSSLENAKKIIASLENANGSLALDMRAKVKAKEEELSAVQNESAERKRRLDSLATELRDLQRKQGDIERAERQNRAQLIRLKALSSHLEKSISGLQSAAVVHEISSSTGQPDIANVEQISEILSDTLVAVKSTLDMAEQFIDEYDDMSVAMTDVDLSSEVGRHIDSIIRNDREAAAKDLRDELDQKRIAVKRLEDAMKKQTDEMKRLRAELGKKRGDDDSEQLRAEIRKLREQNATNMDVLAKKERELSVLRSSLKVDDDDAGYISDDASEQDEDVESCVSPNLNGYGPAEAEALATILSNGRAIDLPSRTRELEMLKNDLLKASGEKEKACRDLKAERESLANAKMIISSLEKANKSMMEDLRSRLQDSNTAIQSLLDKSMEHEKSSSSLRAELERLKKEKEEERKKFKDEAKVFSLRIASKERELNELRQRVGSPTPSSEEKKEEVEEQTE